MKSKIFYLSTLHFLNDGFSAAALLFIPFLAKDFALNLNQVGILGAGINFLPIFLALPALYFAKKFGAFKVLLFSLTLFLLGYFLLGFSNSYFVFVIIFLILGVAFGLFHPIAFPLVSHWSEQENIGKNLGDFTAFGDAGRLVFTAAISFLITFLTWKYTAWLYASLGLIILIVLYVLITRQKVFLEQNTTKQHQDHNFKSLFKNKKFILAILAGGVDNLASSPIFLFLPFLLIYKNISPSFLSSFASVLLIGYIVGKKIIGNFSDQDGAAKMFILTEIFMASLIFSLVFAQKIWLIIVLAFLLGIVTRGTVPATRTLIHNAVKNKNSFEESSSIMEILNPLMATLAPLLLGFLSKNFGIKTAFMLWSLVPFLAIIPTLLLKKISKLYV